MVNTRNGRRLVWVAALFATAAAAGAGAKVVVDYPLADAGGHVHDVVPGKPVDSSNALAHPTDYAQPGPSAGTYGEITLSPDAAATLKSAHFDGDTMLNLGPAAGSALNLTGNFTVTAWVKFDKTDGYHDLIATGPGGGNGWKFGINDGNLTFTANGVADVSVDDQTVDAQKWMFLAVTVAGDKDARTVTFYLNGKKLNADALTADDVKPSDAPQMHIGGAENADSVNEDLAGNLAGLRVYDTALDAAAVKAAAVPAKS